MRQQIKNLGVSACCFLVIFVVHTRAYCDEAKESLPSVRVIWTPSLDKGFVTLSITNKNSYAVKIDPTPYFLYCTSFSLMPVLQRPKGVIRGMLVFGPILVGVEPLHEGQLPGPVAIEVGATSDFKWRPENYVLEEIRKASTAKFFLSYNGKTIDSSELDLENVDGVWKVKR
jgi:hypothetical protein